jgi:hypothetical protein
MKLIIDISEDDYQFIMDTEFQNPAITERLYYAVFNGTPQAVIEADDFEDFDFIEEGMTLDEEIKNCEEVADLYEYDASKYKTSDAHRHQVAVKSAEEYRQLAEWLKDYKRLLMQGTVLDKIRAETVLLDYADFDFEGYYKAVTDVLKIIDKYKAERSGDKE